MITLLDAIGGILSMQQVGKMFYNKEQSELIGRINSQDEVYLPMLQDIIERLKGMEAMSKFKEILHKIPSTRENMQELTEICDAAMDALYKVDKASYDHAIHELEEMAYRIDRDEAEKIVHAMKPYGQKWSYDTIKKFVMEKGIEKHFCKWYLSMNMAYNDYHGTADMVGKAEDAEFYYSMAKDFITDADAKPHKVEKYFKES